MSYLFKSRFYREELMRWILLVALAAWAISATYVATTRKDKLVVIAVSDELSYVVQTTNIARDQKELLAFTKAALNKLYTYDEKSFSANLSSVSDLMSDDLWQERKDEYLKLLEKLKADPLSQISKIESIEEIDANHLKATLQVTIRHKIQTTEIRVRVELEIRRRERTENNPWMFEIASIKDAVI